MMNRLGALFFALALSGCCTVPEADAVRQERALTNVVEARDIKRAQDDPALSAAQKQDVLDFWAAWESWLKDREARLAK